jgi:thiamine biosynthesis lipoprotein ApbE
MPEPSLPIEFDAMASRCAVRVAAPDEVRARAWAARAIDEVRRIEAKYSRCRDDSVIAAIARGAGGAPVAIDIAHPREPGRTIVSIDVADGAVCTSGDYERFFERDGVRYCHVLEPRSGMPVRHGRSVTVVAPAAVAAGGYTTIAMLLEVEAPAHLEATGLPWLAVGPDGAIVSSPGTA